MKNHSLELCQDLTPNTKDGKLIMYAAVWRPDGDSVIQIGITPEHLLSSLKRNDISRVLYRMPMENTVYFIYDSDQDKVVSTTDREYLINSFNSGNTEITFDYEANTVDGDHAYLRRDIFMHENSDGDIIAYQWETTRSAILMRFSYLELITRFLLVYSFLLAFPDSS